MFLARKITRAKWNPKQGLSAGEIPADGVTVDLRTGGNKLSFWQCGSGTPNEVEEAALALATTRDYVDRLDIVWISDGDFSADGLDWIKTKGDTPVADLINLHVDLVRLDYVRLGKVAHRIAAAIEAGRYERLDKGRVESLITNAVIEGRVELDHLKEKVRRDVSQSLRKIE